MIGKPPKEVINKVLDSLVSDNPFKRKGDTGLTLIFDRIRVETRADGGADVVFSAKDKDLYSLSVGDGETLTINNMRGELDMELQIT